jgi:hypothetical protein
MVNIGDKYLYTGEAHTMMNEGSEVVILRRGDRVTIKAFALKNGWVYVIIDELLFTWPVDIKFLTPLEDFPEDVDAFSIFIYKFQQHLRE